MGRGWQSSLLLRCQGLRTKKWGEEGETGRWCNQNIEEETRMLNTGGLSFGPMYKVLAIHRICLKQEILNDENPVFSILDKDSNPEEEENPRVVCPGSWGLVLHPLPQLATATVGQQPRLPRPWLSRSEARRTGKIIKIQPFHPFYCVYIAAAQPPSKHNQGNLTALFQEQFFC